MYQFDSTAKAIAHRALTQQETTRSAGPATERGFHVRDATRQRQSFRIQNDELQTIESASDAGQHQQDQPEGHR